MKNNNKLSEVSEVLDKIEEARSKNNKNWMAILKLAFKYAPIQAKSIMTDITKCDQEISKLCEELTK